MNDPLDVVFVTGEEAKRLEHDRQLARLARYLDNMPMDIKPLFKERFSLIRAAELAQLRQRIAALEATMNEAQELIERINRRTYLKRDLQQEVSAWLAAHPAVTPEQFERAAPVDWREAAHTDRMFDE